MKIIGLLLVLGALVGGGIILSDTVPGWLRNRDYLARAHNELDVAKQKIDAVGPNATEAEIRDATRSSEDAIRSVRFAEEGVERRRNETLMFGGGALAVLALGTFLFLRGRRGSARAMAPS
jgi:hypothetical protein